MNAKKMLKLKSNEVTQPAELTTPSGILKAAPGSNYPVEELIVQATKLIESARVNKAGMAGLNWTEAMTDAVSDKLGKVKQSISLDDRAASKQATQDYKDTVRKGLVFRGHLLAMFQLVALAKASAIEQTTLKIGANPNGARLVKWFAQVESLTESLRPELARVSTVDWTAELKANSAAIEAALARHQQLLSMRAAQATQRRAARNDLAAALNALYVHAVAAFKGNPNVLRQFRKRSETARKAKAAKEASTAEKAAAAPAPAPTPAAAAQAQVAQPKTLLN